jgi:uncharacterized membrane protein YeaQ/YmgE (transglycosylase-associated protein family)
MNELPRPGGPPGRVLTVPKESKEIIMTVTGIIAAIVIGAIIGGLARLILPGKQNIPIWLTIVVGIGAALVGTFLARALGISTNTDGIDWLELLVQLVVAVIAVGAVVGIYSRRGASTRQGARR